MGKYDLEILIRGSFSSLFSGSSYDPERSSFVTQMRERASLILSGVIGSCNTRAPVASNTALAITAPIQIMGGSPPP